MGCTMAGGIMFNDGELVWFCVIDNFGPQQICRSFYGRIIGTTYFCEYDDKNRRKLQ